MSVRFVVDNGLFLEGKGLIQSQLGIAILFPMDKLRPEITSFCPYCESLLWIDALGPFYETHGRFEYTPGGVLVRNYRAEQIMEELK